MSEQLAIKEVLGSVETVILPLEAEEGFYQHRNPPEFKIASWGSIPINRKKTFDDLCEMNFQKIYSGLTRR